MVMASVSCSMSASKEIGGKEDGNCAVDADVMGGASISARAALTAITLPSMPKERANNSMNMPRTRSFITLV